MSDNLFPKSNGKVNSYTAYGLSIHSELPLPQLVAAPLSPADVVIRLGHVNRPYPKTDETGSYVHRTAHEAYFFWEQVGAFLVRCGREIIIEPLPHVAEQTIHLPLLGMVLSSVLRQRGFLVLHASAVALDGTAVVFMGKRGLGKSTMAAALFARGHALLGDDLVALDVNAAGAAVLPGFPQLKLMPEAAAALLGDDPARLPPLVSGYEKRARAATDGFAVDPLPLKCIYSLSIGPTPQIERLLPQETLVQLIGQSYTVRVFKQFVQDAEAQAHFFQCAEIVKTIPVYRLQRPNSLPLLPDLSRLIEEHQ